ncbi:hypothetical protein VOLCADRAFT_103753 [Volvox carteri f. nagariensis]|uniref:EF-hand domain-containing protein n=1 Tax=Volvox carteri f. nagariensis TaxID=3068 RepID=D8TNY7_VOLCA|nr:uncharacterized protein VOLCADRAFT_103753 [Volvox carteri f. nagariensis]EFJ50529.1 hypothetical protein VOLCADRAFT_103753 [Volvox carteri f. nagariensis]|eukprot:XP_002948122.1 hypothetical protein VOLCADRAFT_103753 [Volvox carteri f. nagariensis]
MPKLVQAVHDKVRNFVRNSEQFKRVCESTFDSLDYRSAGRVSLDEAASCVEALFRELQKACAEYGISLDPLTSDDVRAIFRECDYDSNATLDSGEFLDFYASVITYAAMKACVGFGRMYGVGMVGGIVGLVLVKAAVRRLPVVGLLASPLLVSIWILDGVWQGLTHAGSCAAGDRGLVPTLLVGPILGAAVVYGISQNDLFAIRNKLFPPKQGPLRD